MSMILRGLKVALIGVAAGGFLNVARAEAQQRAPEGPIEITVGTSAGGTPDLIMRQLGQALNSTGLVPNPIVVMNRTGGGWTVSNNYVLSQAGNERLLYAIAQPMITTPIVQGADNAYEKLTPIAMLVSGDLILYTHADAKEGTLKEVVERAKKEDRSVSVGGAQAGSTDHLVTARLEKAAGIKLNYVPFDGGGTALAAFLGGNVDMIVLPPSESVDLLKSGQLKPLAILNKVRRKEEAFASIPTAVEQGYDVLWGQYWGIAGPPGLDPEVAAWWSDKLAQVVETDAWKALVAQNYWTTEFVGQSGAGAAYEKVYQEHLEALREVGLAKK
ncbi:putative tricarboxylic transport membrane protein [Pseudorhizobium tarimense]|uniref:Tricarboxylic transport membrane protein n=1 Tax=Pseudorhizobium tarimense TaxID=1079109 RepID=A0ABV2HCW2_9HYPH|nr:tripartite tricarboxylate transporter substrate binding protein [Pseudorhizobium tarimense]MCJ8521436.1 tripartite tricarboxylate transporter substrate binding protein [Pseudorhizobium tarimense]